MQTTQVKDYCVLYAHHNTSVLVNRNTLEVIDNWRVRGDYDLYLISNSDMAATEENKSATRILVRHDAEMDFGMWKTGLTYYSDLILRYKYVIFLNDSVKLIDGGFIERSHELHDENSIVGCSINLLPKKHIQSYYFFMDQQQYRNLREHFMSFNIPETIPSENRKGYLIDNYEIAFGAFMESKGYQMKAQQTFQHNYNLLPNMMFHKQNGNH